MGLLIKFAPLTTQTKRNEKLNSNSKMRKAKHNKLLNQTCNNAGLVLNDGFTHAERRTKMAKSAQEAYDEISAHIAKQGGPYSKWYCGITSDIKTRLFADHNVPKKDHWFAYRECVNNEAARNVEKAFLEHGCDGGEGGGDKNAVYVYAYLKTSITNP
jgi:hypothetical protein